MVKRMWAEPLESIAGGVLWIDAATDLDALITELADWRVAHVPVNAAADKTAMLRSIGAGLDFPEWGGTNLDALYDLLTDLNWLDAATNVAVVLDRSPDALREAVDGWQGIVSVLQDAAAWWQPEPRVFVAILR